MPVLNVTTNVVLLDGGLISSLLSTLSMEVSRVTGKPESYVMVLVQGGAALSFGGCEEEEPAAYCELVSVGGLTPDVNMSLSEALARVFERELSIPARRCYVKFYQDEVQSEQASCLHALHQ